MENTQKPLGMPEPAGLDIRTQALDYFLDFVRWETTSDENSPDCPSSPGQRAFGAHLVNLLEALGLSAVQDSNGYVYARLPASGPAWADAPKLAFIAHMDTSPELTGRDVRPRLVCWNGEDLALDAEGRYRLSAADHPELRALAGEELVVTDGTTLLGADDKAGIAEILTAVAYLQAHPDIPHGPLRVCFTPDEEIGRGVHRIDLKALDADAAFTVDGGGRGELEYESFNAAQAVVEIQGVSVHTGSAKGRMVNAARVALAFMAGLDPDDVPERTDGRAGFFHLDSITGGVEQARLTLLIRDFDRAAFEDRKARIQQLADALDASVRPGRVSVHIRDQYYNMYEVLKDHMPWVELAREAMRSAGVVPVEVPIRGGTDGSQLSFMGVPCPNLFTGGGNYHGRYEYLSVRTMVQAVETLIQLVRLNRPAAGEV